MSWNQRPQGVGPTEGNISFGGGISPRFAAPQNQIADATQQIIAEITEVMRQKERDRIANQLLAVDNAQPAVAVDGTQKGTGQPDTQLTQAMVQRNLGQGLPAQDSGKVPDRGGVEGLQWADLIHKRITDKLKEQEALQTGDLRQQVLRERIRKMQTPPTSTGANGSVEKPLTPFQKAQIEHWGKLESTKTEAPQGPPAAAIDYLKAHPEAAPDFEAKYGPGTSQQYL